MSRFRSPRGPLLFGHRGAPRAVTENTLAGFALALQQGADGVELDARPCASGELVVLHDPDLQRLAGVPRGVADCSLSELRELTLPGGARVCTLQEAAALVLGAGALLNVEGKTDGCDSETLFAGLCAFVQRVDRPQRARLLWSSFDPPLARALSAHGAAAAALLVGRDDRAPSPEQAGCSGLHVPADRVDPALLERWHAGAGFVNVWTVNRPEQAGRLAALGVDGMITDDVPALRAALRAR